MTNDVKGAPKPTRSYVSPRRAEAARRTRSGIVRAATAQFLEVGYVATSLQAVADTAGVARPTVIAAFGTKAGLLSQVLDEALAGDDEPIAVRDRPWFRPVWAADTASGTLAAYSAVCRLMAERAAGVVEVVRRASDSSPEIADLWHGWLRGRRAGAEMVVDREVVTNQLRPGLTPDTATDVLSVLNDPGLYHSLVHERGWTPDAFQHWLADTMCRLLLDTTG